MRVRRPIVGLVVGLVLVLSSCGVTGSDQGAQEAEVELPPQSSTTSSTSIPVASPTSTTTTVPASTTTSTTVPPATTTPPTTAAPTTAPPPTAPPTTVAAAPAFGSPCALGSLPDCIDPDGDGQGEYLENGARCMANLASAPELCIDLDGDGRAGYPDSG